MSAWLGGCLAGASWLCKAALECQLAALQTMACAVRSRVGCQSSIPVCLCDTPPMMACTDRALMSSVWYAWASHACKRGMLLCWLQEGCLAGSGTRSLEPEHWNQSTHLLMPVLGWLSLLRRPLLHCSLLLGGLFGWPSSQEPGGGLCALNVLPVLDRGGKACTLTPLLGCRLAMLGVTDHLVHERLSADQYSHWGILLEQKVGRAARDPCMLQTITVGPTVAERVKAPEMLPCTACPEAIPACASTRAHL